MPVVYTPDHVEVRQLDASRVVMLCRHCANRWERAMPADVGELGELAERYVELHRECPAPTILDRMWVIYHGASNHAPGLYVVRAHYAMSNGSHWVSRGCHECTSLESARSMVPAGCENIGRQPGDDPVIVEVWR